MTDLTVERRPNRMVAIRGLLDHPAVVAVLAEALAGSAEARNAVAALADAGSPELYVDAVADLADALRHVWISVPARDLASVVEAVESRTLVVA